MELISPLYMNIMAMAAILLGLALTAWWIVGLISVRSRDKDDDLPKETFGSDIQEVITGIPAVLKIFFTFMVLTMIGYVLYIWLGGVSY